MVTHPKEGMRYKDAIKTATRHSKEGSAETVNSMAEQVNRHEGPKAAAEFAKEAIAKGNEERSKGRRYF